MMDPVVCMLFCVYYADEICKCSYVWRFLTLILYPLDTCLSSDSLVWVVEVHDVVHRLPCEAEVDHPVHQVEGDEHDGEDDPTVLVNVTGPHAK